MQVGPHPLLNPNTAPAVGMNGENLSYANDVNTHIDGTPYCLFGLVIGAAAVLAALKYSGFKFVIGVGG